MDCSSGVGKVRLLEGVGWKKGISYRRDWSVTGMVRLKDEVWKAEICELYKEKVRLLEGYDWKEGISYRRDGSVTGMVEVKDGGMER